MESADDISASQNNKLRKVFSSFKRNYTLWISELNGILQLTITMSLLVGIRITYPVISLIMNGHIDTLHLDAVALANSVVTLTCTSISGGFSYAVSTVFAHLMGRPSYRKQIATVAQRAILLYSLYGLLMISVYINIEPILLLCGQNPIVSKLSSHYLLVWIPCAVLEMWIMVLNRYLLVQDHKLPCILISVGGLSMNVIAQYLMLTVFKLNYLMSAACHVISYLLMILLFLVYIKLSKIYISTWEGLQPLKAMCSWWELSKFSLNSAFFNFCNYFLADISMISAGLLGIDSLSVFGVLYNLFLTIVLIDTGFGCAINIRLSAHLGSADMKSFRIALKLCYLLLFGLIVAEFTGIMLLRNELPQLYTNSVDIQEAASRNMIFFALWYVVDNFTSAFMSIVTSSASYLIIFVSSLTTNFIIGLPTAILLAFVAKLDVAGLIIGGNLATLIQGVIFAVKVFNIKWENLLK